MAALTPGRIRHGVVFRLVHPDGSEGEAAFLRATAQLASIGGVEAFELLREVSPKNPYRFGLTMEFTDRAAYEAYNAHPDHVRYVDTRWQAEVAEFMEIDTAPL